MELRDSGRNDAAPRLLPGAHGRRLRCRGLVAPRGSEDAVAAGITAPTESFAIAGVGGTLTFEGAGLGDGDVASWVPEDAACGEAATATAVVQDGGAEFVFNNTAAATEGALRLCAGSSVSTDG